MEERERIIKCFRHMEYEIKCKLLGIGKDFIAFEYKKRPYTLDFNNCKVKYQGTLIIGDDVAELLTYIFVKIYLLPDSEILHGVE